MDSILIKYSDFFDDDGGFSNLKKDFINLGAELVTEANRIKKEVNDAFAFGNPEALAKQEKQVEELAKSFENFSNARESMNKVEEEYQKLLKKGTNTNEDRIKSLADLDKSLNQYRLDLKKANQFEKQGIDTGEDLNKVRVEAQINIKKTQVEIRKLQKEVVDSNKLSREEEKLLKAKIILQKDEIETIGDIRERLSALRLVQSQVNITTEEGAAQIAAYNEEINELTELLSDNSDKFIQNKINVGNYEESIIDALKGQQLFTTNLGALDGALSGILALLTLNTEQLAALEKSTEGNISATKRFALAFGRLNKVLKASIIGAIILLIASLSAVFGNTRAGAVRLEKIMATLGTTITIVGQIAKAVFVGIGDSFGVLFDVIKSVIDQNKGKSFLELLGDFFSGDTGLLDAFVENASGQFANLKETISDIIDLAKSGSEAVIAGLDNIDRAFALEDRVRRLSQEVERLNGQLQIQQQISDDSTKSLQTQLEANERALDLTEQVGKRQVEIAKAQLEAANERVKQNILANGVEADSINLGLQGEAFAKATLDLATRRGVQLEISNDLLDEQQQLVLEVIKAENELDLNRAENSTKQREIQRDLFEQNLDLLIDLIDTEKNLSEQLVNDARINFQRRVQEFNRFLVAFRTNAQRELDQFTTQARNAGLELDFQVGFDENGELQVFVNDTELAVDNIVELNKQLQGLGIDEITINRFREFIVEAQNGVRDFRDLNKELVLEGINVKELFENISVSQDEINALTSLQDQINNLLVKSRGDISRAEREQILKDIQELEDRKTDIAKFAEFQRLNNRKDAINAELQTVEEGSQRELELKQGLLDIEKKLLEDGIDASIDALEKINKKGLEGFKKFADELNRLIGAVLDALVKVNQERIERAEEATDKQEEQISKQEDRAAQGLENTLAFEQKELAKREAELIAQQKRQERLEKVKSLYSSYSNYASRGEEDAILKTLRDFSILEGIVASFGDGGLAEDVIGKVPTDGRGITRGRSHRGNQGGIPVLIEGNEGFFSKKEVGNMGKDNFYKLKSLASTGPLSENFFSGQKSAFVQGIPAASNNSALEKGIAEVKKAIESKPVSDLNVPEVVDGILRFVQTTHTKNKRTRNHHKVSKSRI